MFHSDMLHNTTGDKSRDHFLSMDLVHEALEFTSSNAVLKPRGSFLAKYLRGSDEQDLVSEVKERFHTCKIIKPKASRMESKEMYILGMNKKSTCPSEEESWPHLCIQSPSLLLFYSIFKKSVVMYTMYIHVCVVDKYAAYF